MVDLKTLLQALRQQPARGHKASTTMTPKVGRPELNDLHFDDRWILDEHGLSMEASHVISFFINKLLSLFVKKSIR